MIRITTLYLQVGINFNDFLNYKSRLKIRSLINTFLIGKKRNHTIEDSLFDITFLVKKELEILEVKGPIEKKLSDYIGYDFYFPYKPIIENEDSFSIFLDYLLDGLFPIFKEYYEGIEDDEISKLKHSILSSSDESIEPGSS